MCYRFIHDITGGSQKGQTERLSHFLSNTSASGQDKIAQLREAFVRLYCYLTSLLVSPSADVITSSLIVNFWCLSFKPEDHAFLMDVNVLDILHRLMTSTSELNKARRKLRVLGRLAFRYLTIQCLTDAAIHRQQTAAQRYLVETIVTDLEKSINFIHLKRQDLGRVVSSGDIGTMTL